MTTSSLTTTSEGGLSKAMNAEELPQNMAIGTRLTYSATAAHTSRNANAKAKRLIVETDQ
ncbi:hypothetical protein KIN20_021433 [Parelaphostrongylus tenuis]|uniref:Uncharacterized protein n=1 Tax=Parelaphostrongylus tenuis TaxID=148309 RepID=A0AAD5NAU9_PARTN|nr:hypothetical protein KIN20_021433 [Parelaphostrongylus tenuis]